LILLTVALISPAPIRSQPPTPKASPVTPDGSSQSTTPIVAVPRPVGSGKIEVDVTNSSAKPIRGYVIDISFYRVSDGQPISKHTRTALMAGVAGIPGPLMPGETQRALKPIPVPQAGGKLARYRIAIDLVMFSDGTHWGPINLRESDRLVGMINGIDVVLAKTRTTSTNPQSPKR